MISLRRDRPNIAVNCPAIPGELLESELFGHEKGAFTGAIERKDGKFLAANAGSIFLDEIGDMSPSLQAKILRVLESGEIERVGGAETIQVDVRIISATNQNLEQKINEGTFRQDLFHRINVFPITVPPIRERKEDILPTAMSILKSLKKKHKISVECFSHDALQTLMAYDWPGNVRELRNLVERITILTANEKKNNINKLIEDILNPSKSLDINQNLLEKSFTSPLKEARKHFEKEYLLTQLKKNHGNISKTADFIGMERSALHRKLKSLGIKGIN